LREKKRTPQTVGGTLNDRGIGGKGWDIEIQKKEIL